MARINFYTSESKLRREFESYGSIKKIVMVKSPDSDKPRGYAFIEYEHERDMHCEFTKKTEKRENTQFEKKNRKTVLGCQNFGFWEKIMATFVELFLEQFKNWSHQD